MAPKRKIIQSDNVSRPAMKRRVSKRLGGVNINDEITTDVMAPSIKKQIKKKINKKKSISNKNNQTNSEIIIEHSSAEQSIKSMSVDSVNHSDSNEIALTSIDESSISPSNHTRIKASTRRSVNSDDDDDSDEFRRMFMSTTPKFKSNSNYSSTPLRASGKCDRNVHTTNDFLPSYGMKDTALGRLSNSTTNHHSTVSDSPIKNIKTPTYSHVMNGLRKTQTCSSIRSLCSVPTASNNKAILETFAEYRNLKRDFDRAVKENEVWSSDFKALTNQMKKLQQSSFPRPSADGRAFIEELLYSLKNSENDEDTRTNAELAENLGLSEATLMSLSNTDPRKTSLRIFNALFPTNQDKEALYNVAKLITDYPDLLEDILAFARRCSPGCCYTLTMLKGAIGNSIRCARHNMKRASTHNIAAAAVAQLQMY